MEGLKNLLDFPSVNISWTPNVIYDGSQYTRVVIGHRGPGQPSRPKKLMNTGVPYTIVLIIESLDENILDDIIQHINEENDNNDVVIASFQKVTHVEKKTLLKDYYSKEEARIVGDNDVIWSKYQSLLQQMKNMGCNVDHIGEPTLEKVPDHYWNYETIAKKGRLELYCHVGTFIYDHLKQNGTLDKTFPPWFRDF